MERSALPLWTNLLYGLPSQFYQKVLIYGFSKILAFIINKGGVYTMTSNFLPPDAHTYVCLWRGKKC